MIEVLALAAVVAAGLYLIALGTASLLTPSRAANFLLGFAGTPFKHFLELALRLIVGGALILLAPRMYLSGAFNLAGWVLLATTACLLLIPWRWHHRFAQCAVPLAMQHLKLVGSASLALGGLILVAVVRGS